MRTRELRALLRRLGCEEARQSGSHLIVRCGRCQTVVPVHTGDIPPGTLRSIERDLTPCLGKGWLS
ncbi:MAG: type II toxin-antitoxin system HicA family toxin [Acidimicrobiales bacterium]